MDQHRPPGLSDLFDHKRRFTSSSLPPPADERVGLLQSRSPSSPPCCPLFPILPALLPDVPGTATSSPTPTHDLARPDFGIVDCALPCSSLSLPSPQLQKPASALRLPSFDLLGIAAPHPDYFQPDADRFFSPVGAGPLSKPDDPLHARSPGSVDHLPLQSPRLVRKEQPAGEQYTTLPTPPPDLTQNYWGNISHVRASIMDSPARSDPETTPPAAVPPPDAPPAAEAPEDPLAQSQPSDGEGTFPWLNESLQTISKSIAHDSMVLRGC